MSDPAENSPDFETIQASLRAFAKERDWDQFHSPKNLVMALVGEMGELVEHFQWLTQAQSRNLTADKLQEVREEVADIQIYLLMLSEKLGIDLISAVEEKISKNEAKYPAEKARGSSQKYTDL